MQQAVVIPVGYSNISVEILANNAAPEAEAVYAALGVPFSTLVCGLKNPRFPDPRCILELTPDTGIFSGQS